MSIQIHNPCQYQVTVDNRAKSRRITMDTKTCGAESNRIKDGIRYCEKHYNQIISQTKK